MALGKRWAPLWGAHSSRASLAHFHPHSCRHLFATTLVKAGVPLAKISKILGHSSIEITIRVYTHLFPVDLLGAADNLGLH